jgi:hypothetical protein
MLGVRLLASCWFSKGVLWHACMYDCVHIIIWPSRCRVEVYGVWWDGKDCVHVMQDFFNGLWSLRLHMLMMVVIRFHLAAILAQRILVRMVKVSSSRFEFWYPSILMIWLFQMSQR